MAGKKCYTVIALLLLILLYIMIFILSAEDADHSSNISTKVTRALLQLFSRIRGSGGGRPVAVDMVSSTEGFVRKLAHFSEYACVGFLSYSIVAMWYGTRWKGKLVVILQLLISAGADEFHQYFVPGRNASIKDVLIDTAGGIAGMIVISVWITFWRKLRKRTYS